MLLALDGLSIDMFRSFLTDLENVPMSFTKIYEQNMIFQKAMSKVICVPGQLHMSFHMLQCIFTIFTDLLSCSQKCLEWKKLTHKQVSLSYNLCKSLLFITVEETERLLINLFVKEKCEDISDHVEKCTDEKILAIQLAMDLETYIELKAKHSKDGRLKYL